MSNKPITARIKRTTKGGMVTQPLLNMGSPVKMKMSSPAKQDVDPPKKSPSSRAEKASAKRGKLLPSSKTRKFDAKIKDHKAKKDGERGWAADDKARSEKLASPAKQGGRSREGNKMVSGKKLASKVSASDKIKTRDREKAENKIRQAHIDKYKNNPNATASDKKSLKDVQRKIESTSAYKDSVATKSGEAGWAADDKARKNKTGSYSPKETKITGKVGSDLRRKQYEDKGWAHDATTKKPKVKKVEKIKGKQVASTPKTKLDPKVVKAQVKKVNTKKETSSKAAEIRAKGNAVLANKSLTTEQKQKQSKKLRRKYDKVTAKDIKKKERKERNPKYDSTTGTGGSVAGNFLRSLTGKRKRDRKAAQQRKSQASKAVSPD